MVVNLPALLVGVIVAVYWARVLRMTRRSKRRVGRLANLIPGETVGVMTRLIWVPVVGLWIALPLLAALGRPRGRGFHALVQSTALGWVGVVIAVLAFAMTLICWKRMGRSWRIGIDPVETTPLVVAGPYASVRHPIYALSSLLMLATIAVWPTTVMCAVGLIHLALLQFETRREEAHLLRVHGAIYQDYCRRTPRFFPRIFR
ncbi:MAG: isoprenylcysteine carboxylmethyltransferase family protein [Planctomycetota bacterium]|nr:isoprenylcysteine carboxylmethyltransferase family protein [Planctomycetota bacterium]